MDGLPDADKILALYAFLDHQDIWHELFTSALDFKISTKLPDWYPQFFAQAGVSDHTSTVGTLKGWKGFN